MVTWVLTIFQFIKEKIEIVISENIVLGSSYSKKVGHFQGF